MSSTPTDLVAGSEFAFLDCEEEHETKGLTGWRHVWAVRWPSSPFTRR